jgi:hypothetical protein
MQRLVVLSVLLIFAGLILLLPSSPLVSLITSGSTTASGSGSPAGAGASVLATADATTTIESLLGFGLVGVGLVLEVFSLFTKVGSTSALAESSEARRP